MSKRGYLNSDREKKIALILDGLFDFNRIVKKKVFWGAIDLGKMLEKRDYNIFLAGIKIVDNTILEKGKNPEAAEKLDKALSFLENKDILGFNMYVSDLAAEKIDIPLVQNEKEIFISVLLLLRGSLQIALDKLRELKEAAEKENFKLK